MKATPKRIYVQPQLNIVKLQGSMLETFAVTSNRGDDNLSKENNVWTTDDVEDLPNAASSVETEPPVLD